MTTSPDRLASALADRYRIARELGEGGMATVYLAEDLKHQRQVAIKVLRPELAAVIGAERFLAEIKTTAQLQHPHILPLFDSGTAGGFLFYVMPYVEGESLRDRLDREKQLPVADALRIAGEVADALDYAHRHGVIHRDIKPENILLHDGQALVSDFGIALAVSSAGGARLTETGLSLGTPRYMSPEQATGQRDITARSDIYALGVTTYEMLAGEPPFTGPNAQAIVAKVMTEAPVPLRKRRHTVTPAMEAAILGALEKLPADRQQTAAEFAAALRAPADPSIRRGRSRRLRPAAAAVMLFLLGATAGLVLERATRGRTRAAFTVGTMTKVTWDDGLETMPAISPDGRSVAYAAGTSRRMRVFVRQIGGGRALPISDDSVTTQWGPQWSPDGTRILFVTPAGVFSAPAGGGSARQEVPGTHRRVISGTWSPDGRRVAFAAEDTVFVREADGTIHELTRLEGPGECVWGKNDLLACTTGNPDYGIPGVNFGNLGPSSIVVVRAADGTVHTVTDSSSMNLSPAWTRDGWLLFLSNRQGPADIYAQRVNEGGVSQGAPVRLTVGLGVAALSASADGARVAFAATTTTANIWSLPIPEHPPALISAASQITRSRQFVESISVSRDGQWLLYDSDVAGNVNIYRLRLAGGRPEQLTFLPGDEFSPGLSPDNADLVYHAWDGGSREIYLQPLDGGPIQQLTSTTAQEARPRWSPDGRMLTWFEISSTGGIWVARRDAKGAWTARRRLANGFWPAWSPDNVSFSYSTNMYGGRPMVGTVGSSSPYELTSGGKWPRVTTSGWSADGRNVYFKGTDSTGSVGIWAFPREGGAPTLMARLDDPRLLAERHTFAVGARRFFFTLYDRQSDVWVMNLQSTENDK